MRASYSLLAPLLLCGVLLSGCGTKSVDVVQPEQFKILADHMGKELKVLQVLDSDNAYVAPLFSSSTNDYGQQLFKRLSPAFIFEDSTFNMSFASFNSSVSASDRASVGDNGFIIKYLRQTVTVNMIALLDWNNDGNTDWLVSCLVEPRNGARTRDYTVIISNPKPEGPLEAQVIGVYECFGLACTQYMRESVAAPASNTELDGKVSDTVPGLKPVTMPPGSEMPAGSKEEVLQERNLD